MKVKICGIMQPQDAIAATEAGADFVGMVFVPRRRRRLEIGQGKAVVGALKESRADPPQIVGLFADQSWEEVNEVIAACQLDLVQLCGEESVDYCGQVKAQVIKVIHIEAEAAGAEAAEAVAQRIEAYSRAGNLVTLDRLVEGIQGGTGYSFDWEIAALLSGQGHSFLLAGGLTPENVSPAVAAVRPWGVDVSSGVETDGVKDHQKIRAFIANAKGATQSN